MINRFGNCRMWCLAGMLGLAPLLLAPSAAFALFPPVVARPAAAPQVVVMPTVVDPPAVVVGVPEPIPVDPPVTAKTPEPATLVSSLIGIAFGVRLLKRRKAQS